MPRILSKGIVTAALVLLAVVGLTGAPRAQTAPELGAQFAHEMMGALDFEALLQQEIAKDPPPGMPNGWDRYMVEAFREELPLAMPRLEAEMGRGFARHFTADELQIGIEMMRGPAGGWLKDLMRAGSAGKEGREPTAAEARAMTRINATPAGRRFGEKFANIDKAMDGMEERFVIIVMPGVLRRMADKMDADEARRLAGEAR